MTHHTQPDLERFLTAFKSQLLPRCGHLLDPDNIGNINVTKKNNLLELELPHPIIDLGDRLGLSRAAQHLITFAIAPHYDHDIACLYGVVAHQNNPTGLTRDVLAFIGSMSLHALDQSPYGAPLLEDGPLQRMNLIQPESGQLMPTAALRACLSGRDTIPANLLPFTQHLIPGTQPPILPNALQPRLTSMLRTWATPDTLPPLTSLIGPFGTGRTLIANQLAGARGLHLLKVTLAQTPPDLDPKILEREALWLGAALLLYIDPDVGLTPPWRRHIHALAQTQIPLILAHTASTLPPSTQARPLARLDVPHPDLDTRKRLFRRYLPPRVRAPDLTDAQLAFRFRGTGRDIAHLSQLALDEATQDARRHIPQVTLPLLSNLAHNLQSGSLSGLGHFVKPFTDGLDAVILPQNAINQLHEVLTRARYRRQVLVDWGLGSRMGEGLGNVVLLSGPPGTGKTLSAKAVAHALTLPLYRVDLSQLVSKWLGETEKHLAAVFNDAERSGAALLFDEADAMFAKRTNVTSSNDRHANLEVGYLLQRIETFSGICFLTTNLASSIDPAFERRVSIHIRYDLPKETERQQIWRSLIPPQLPADPDIDFDKLAHDYPDVSGGDIRNAVLRAAYIAAGAQNPLNQTMLAYAITTELSARGKLVRQIPRDRSWDNAPKGDKS